MKKIMISQPVAGKTEEEIKETVNKFLDYADKNGLEVVKNVFTHNWYSKENMISKGVVNISLFFLSKTVENMAFCNIIYFAKGWEKIKRCRIEHDIAVKHNIEIVYAED